MSAPTPAEIQQAVAWGQQVATMRILEALRKQRPKRDGWRLDNPEHGVASGATWDPDMYASQQAGYDAAMRVVQAFRIDTKEDA